MHYIFRVAESWTIYDKATNKSRLLSLDEIELMKKLFGNILNDPTKMISSVKVEAIAPSRFQNLPMPGK